MPKNKYLRGYRKYNIEHAMPKNKYLRGYIKHNIKHNAKE